MPTRDVYPTSATFAWDTKPTTNYSVMSRDRMRIDSGQANIYLRFVVDIPEGEQLTSVTLRMATVDSYAGSRTFTAQRVDVPESYSTLNWNNRPSAAAGSSTHTFVQSTSAKLCTWDLTSDFTGRRVVNMRIISDDTTARHFTGTRAPSGKPRLVVVTQPAPVEPTGLMPDGGAVSLAQPTYQWNAHEDALGYKLQIDEADGDFSTPLYESATVTSSEAAAAPAYSLTNGTEYDWRVAYLFASGLGDWSDPATINRVTKSSLTISNPGATDADPTPPVTWVFGGTQVAWQVVSYRNGVPVDDSGKKVGTDTAYAPKKGAAKAGDEVTREVRVWDDQDRVPSSGDPTYTGATQVTTYVPTPTVAAISSVHAEQLGDSPAVLVDWTRSAGLPDEVILERAVVAADGSVDFDIIDRHDGIDGAFTDWTCPPNTEVSYRVTAVVEGEAADDGPTATLRTRVTGAWLVDPDEDRWFSVSGDGLSLGYGSTVQTYTPLAAAAEIKRTSSLRGAAGDVSGQIATVDGKTPAEQVADVWWMRERPHRTFRLVLGDLNVPVTCSDVWASFDPATSLTHRIDKTARFTFSQTADELPFEPI